MRKIGQSRRKPLVAAVVAVVLAFAVVCPLMAAPGIPVDQGCHGGSEPSRGAEQTTVVCCSSVTVPKVLTPEPGSETALASFAGAQPVVPVWNSRLDSPLPRREAKPPLFVQHASLLI